MNHWDFRMMHLARFWADLCSKDPTTKVGAVLVGVNKNNVALGYNGFPPGVEDTPERLADRETKHKLVQHAERNAIDNAGFNPQGGTLYVTMFPCSECCKSAVSKGISRVVCTPSVGYAPWMDDAVWAKLIMREGGIQLEDWFAWGHEKPADEK